MISAPSPDSTDHDHGFQIAPMVDVVFVLLLFFMALAGMRQIEKRMSAHLPAPAASFGEPPLVIDITRAGAVLCNGVELLPQIGSETKNLDEWLKTLASTEPTVSVLIRPDADAEHEHFIRVLASLKNAGLQRISFH